MAFTQLRKVTLKELHSPSSNDLIVSILKSRLPVIITGVPGIKERVNVLRELGGEIPNMKEGGFF